MRNVVLLSILLYFLLAYIFLPADNNTNKIIEIEDEEFCGKSTYGSCITDSECRTGGCSGQICQSILDNSRSNAITTCEYRSCYNESKYGLECRCVNSRCQWD